jgi:hypothetical protein
LAPTDAEMTDRIESELTELTTQLLEHGAATVVWITPPDIDNELPDSVDRNQVLVDAMHTIAQQHPTQVYVVDLRGFLIDTGQDVDPGVRPDGVHFAPEASLRIAEEYLGEQVLRAALALEPR